MKYSFLILLSCFSILAKAELLDKISGVINDKIFTLSEIKNVSRNFQARTEIAPVIFETGKNTEKEILNSFYKVFIIRDKLSTLGYSISDEMVEERISSIEKSQGVSRKELEVFLKQKNINFNDYFEMIRQSIEFSYFNNKVISPLVAVSEQEIKNFYHQKISSNQVIAFKYSLVDFIFEAPIPKSYSELLINQSLKKYQATGELPKELSSFTTQSINNLSGDSLSKDVSAVLAKTNEGDFTPAININGTTHIFYVEKKDTAESTSFLKEKENIYQVIYVNKSKEILDRWIENEKFNYYIVEF